MVSKYVCVIFVLTTGLQSILGRKILYYYGTIVTMENVEYINK